MNSEQFCLSGDDSDENRFIGAKLDKEETVKTKDGQEYSHEGYAKQKEDKIKTLEVNRINKVRIDEMQRDRRKSRARDGNRPGWTSKYPGFDNDAFYDESSCVTDLTIKEYKERIMEEHIKKLVEENKEEFLPVIRQHVADLVTLFVQLTYEKKNKMFRTQISTVVLLLCTIEECDIHKAVNYIDSSIEEFIPDLKYRAKDNMGAIKSVFKRISASNGWMSDFLKVITTDANGQKLPTSKHSFQFHPAFALLAATNPDAFRRGWFKRLPQPDKPYTLNDLKKDIPDIVEVNKGFINLSINKPKEQVPGNGMSKPLKARKNANDSGMYALLKEFKARCAQYKDMKQWEFILTILVTSKEIIFMSASDWAKACNDFIKNHSIANPKLKEVTNMMVSSMRRNKLNNTDLAISKLYYSPAKSNIHPIFGVIPDARSIPIDRLWMMADPTKRDQGWIILDEECKRNEHIGRHAYPERYKDESFTEKVSSIISQIPGSEDIAIDEGKMGNPSSEIEREEVDHLVPDTSLLDGLEVLDVEDEEPTSDAMMILASAVKKIADKGVNVNFNIGFGRPAESNGRDLSDAIHLMEHTNSGLNIALERMGLLMESIHELTDVLKK